MSDFKIVSLLNPVQNVYNISQTGVGVGIEAGISSQTSGNITLGSSAGNVTFGMQNGYITASAPSGGGGGSNYVFSNANGVSFGTLGSTVTATVATNYMASNQASNFQSAGAYLTTAAQSNHSHSLNQILNPTGDVFFSFSQNQQIQFQFSNTGTFTTNASKQAMFEIDIQGNLVDGADGVHIHQSDNNPNIDLLHIEAWGTNVTGLRISASASIAAEINKPIKFVGTGLQTASVPMILQTGMTNSVQYLNANFLQGKVSSEFQSTGAYITTAAQSNHSHAFATTTTNGAVIVVGTTNSAGATIGVPSFLTTYVGQTNQTAASGNIAGVGTTFAGTNVTATMALNSAGLGLSLSAGAGGGGADGYNSAQFTNSTANSTMPLVWAGNSNGSGNVTIGLTGSTITMSAAGGGGAGDGYNILGVNVVATSLSTTYILSNANNVSFGLNLGTITASASYVNDLTSGRAGVGYTSTTQAGAVVGVTNNTAGLSMAWPPFLTTAGATNALTTARASNDALGLNTALTANGVSITANSSGVSWNFPAFLTTAAQSTHSHNFATTVTAGAVVNVATANSAGVTVGMPAFITTYVAQTNQTVASGNIAGVGTTFAGTNITATMGLNSAGLALSLSGAGGGTINQTGPNIAVAGSTVTSGDVYFSNSPTVTFGMNGSTITASAAGGGGGGGATINGYELFPPLGGNTAFSTGVNGTLYFQKFIAPANIAFSNFERRYSGSTVSSAISAQAAHSISYGLYSKGTGASTSIYNLIASSNFFMQASYSSNLSAGHTVSAGATSYTNSSAGTVGQGNLTGYKHMYFPFVSTLTAGVEYAYAQIVSSATTGATGPLRIGFQELSIINNLTIGKIYNSTVAASNASYVGDWAQGVYSSSSNGLPSTLAISGLTNAVSQQRMYLQLDA
jgi:hypothetical protein